MTLFGFPGGTVAVDFSVERRGVATTIGGERNGESQVGGEPAPGRSQSRNISVNHYRFFTGGIFALFLAYTALRYIDKDNFECPELGVVQKCSIILGEYQSPGGKFF